MKKILDARQLDCPMPVIEAQKLLKEDIGVLEVLVGNMTARENIKRLATSLNYEFDVQEEGNDNYKITIVKNPNTKEEKEEVKAKTDDKVYMIVSDTFGKGEEELGKLLMKSLVYTLTQTEPYPKKILLLNSGVKLSTENEEIILHLKDLESKGTQIFSCGTCLNYYNLAEKLQVGLIGNMYDVVEGLNNSEIINIG